MKKLFFMSADANGHIDGTTMVNLYNGLTFINNPHEADAIVVPVSYFSDYKFNTDLLLYNKPIILFDFLEYFGFHSGRTNIIGLDDLPRNMMEDSEWKKLYVWANTANIKCYFKRELFRDNQYDYIHPIEWPCYIPPMDIDTKEAFYARPFDVFYNWGYSNAYRPKFQGEAFDLMSQGKIEVISNWHHLDAKRHEPYKKWICIHTPHTHRISIDKIANVQMTSICSVSLPGSGVKCFRSTESPFNTIPVMLNDNIVWSQPWIDGYNCILIDPNNMVKNLYEKLNLYRDMLYDIYLQAQNNLDLYRTENYINDYVYPIIQRSI